MENNKNTTFLSYEELLRSQFELCGEVCRDLNRFVERLPEPAQKSLGVFIEHENNLAETIKHFLDQAPPKVLNTRLQFTSDCEEIRCSQTLNEAYNQAVEFNKCLLEQYESAINNINGDVAELLDNLRNKVRYHCRRVSMLLVTMQDV